MAFTALSVLVVLFVGVPAFRVKPKRGGEDRRNPPQVDGIFAFAAPGSADNGLTNPRSSSGCFPGVRNALVRHQWWGQEADLATTVTGVIGFRHPKMDFSLVDEKNDARSNFYPCDNETPNRPRGTPNIALHAWQLYQAEYESRDFGWGELWYYLSNLALPNSYSDNSEFVHARAREYNWSLIGSAVDPGGFAYVGEQVSHLFQQDSSGECILTFQGSSSPEDWVANLNVDKINFCGYGARGERVHEGFKDALMHIVNDTAWQNNVRPKLSTCSKVYVTGHSLGGAQAELFGACANMAPQAGEDGYEDYKYIGW